MNIIKSTSNIGNIANEINKFVNKNIYESQHQNLMNAVEAVQKIWTRDVVVRQYTSHRLDHNIRVLYYCIELINSCRIKIDPTGCYILVMAALLHDFGMQCTDKEIIMKYAKHEKIIDPAEVEKVIRKNHAKICVDWIGKLYNSTTIYGKLISLIDPRQMQPICEVIKYHSGKDLYELRENLTYIDNNNERLLLPVILLLRLADELDIGCERSNYDILLRNDLHEDNLSYFWLHYITNISFVSNCIIKISIETNSIDKDKHEFFKEIIYERFMKKNKPLFDMLWQCCKVQLSILFEAKTNDFLEPFNPVVYDYLFSKYSVDERYFDDLVLITHNVPDIGDVFELDSILLPMIYRGGEHYAVTKEQSYLVASINPNMTIGAYKRGKLIGYLTLWPVMAETLDRLLSFEITESEVDLKNEILTYDIENVSICWYVTGLGVDNEERGRKNSPIILKQLIDEAINLAREMLQPRSIKVTKIGAITYSRSAENLCLRHFGMSVIKYASYDIEGYIPKSVCVEVDSSSVPFILELKKSLNM
jgi:Predicted HD superfamily hydrolase